eukprot:gene3800-15602_t
MLTEAGQLHGGACAVISDVCTNTRNFQPCTPAVGPPPEEEEEEDLCVDSGDRVFDKCYGYEGLSELACRGLCAAFPPCSGAVWQEGGSTSGLPVVGGDGGSGVRCLAP